MKKTLIFPLIATSLVLFGCDSSSSSESTSEEESVAPTPFCDSLIDVGYTFVESYPTDEVSLFIGTYLEDIPSYDEDYGYTDGYYFLYVFEDESEPDSFTLVYNSNLINEYIDYLYVGSFIVSPDSYSNNETFYQSRDENKNIEINLQYDQILDITYVSMFYYDDVKEVVTSGYTYSDTIIDLTSYFDSDAIVPSISASEGCYVDDNVEESNTLSIILPNTFAEAITLPSGWTYSSSTDTYTASGTSSTYTLSVTMDYSLDLGNIYTKVDLVIS